MYALYIAAVYDHCINRVISTMYKRCMTLKLRNHPKWLNDGLSKDCGVYIMRVSGSCRCISYSFRKNGGTPRGLYFAPTSRRVRTHFRQNFKPGGYAEVTRTPIRILRPSHVLQAHITRNPTEYPTQSPERRTAPARRLKTQVNALLTKEVRQWHANQGAISSKNN